MMEEVSDSQPGDKPAPITCSICSKEFRYQSRLREHHIKAHSEIHRCIECDMTFDNKRSLLKHQKIHNVAAGTIKQPHVCQDCGRKCVSLSALQIHIRYHTGERPYECQICQKRFVDKSALTQHKRIHSGEKKYKCNECGDSFSRSGSLKYHVRTHSGEKPYSCMFCDKGFSVSSSMYQHVRTVHLELKPHECQFCKKRFDKSSNLNQHLKSHKSTGEKKNDVYKCKECGKKLATPKGLSRHVRKKHADSLKLPSSGGKNDGLKKVRSIRTHAAAAGSNKDQCKSEAGGSSCNQLRTPQDTNSSFKHVWELEIKKEVVDYKLNCMNPVVVLEKINLNSNLAISPGGPE